MPIQSTTISEEIELAATELAKLAKFDLKINLPRKNIMHLVNKLDKLELMILDAALKDQDLVKLRNTILVLEEPYLIMLHNVLYWLIAETNIYASTKFFI